MDDLEGQYCNRNSVGCSASSLPTAELLVILSCYFEFIFLLRLQCCRFSMS